MSIVVTFKSDRQNVSGHSSFLQMILVLNHRRETYEVGDLILWLIVLIGIRDE